MSTLAQGLKTDFFLSNNNFLYYSRLKMHMS